MRRNTARASLPGAFVLFSLVFAGPAHACNEPVLMVNPTEAGPGNVVQYAITGLTPGGAYQLTVEGEPVASGTASGTVARGTFPMRDLGATSTRVSVEGVVQHSDIEGSPTGTDEWRVSTSLDYRAPQSPPTQEPQPQRPVSQGGEATGPQPAAPQGTTSPGPRPNTSAGPRVSEPGSNGPGGAPKRSAHRPHGAPGPGAAERAVGDTGAASGAATGQAPGQQAVSTSSNPQTARTPAHDALSRSSAVRAARKGGRQAAAPVPPSLSSIPRAFVPQRVVARSDEDLPLGVLIAVSALLVLGLAGGWWARVRSRRPGPEPEPQLAAAAIVDQDTQEFDAFDVEAALQELIAEERARGLVTLADRRERSEPAREESGAPP